MADEQIVNTLGFNVEDALGALQRLDTALQATGRAFGTFGEALDTFNGRAAAVLKTMRSLATAAGNLSTAMSNMPSGAATPTAAPAAAAASPSFWLPPGMEAEAKRLDAALRNVGAAGAEAGGKVATGFKPANDVIDEGKKKTEKFTLTWQTLGRVVMTQMIVRTMSQIRDALHEAVEASIEFQQHIAEIQTVAPQIGGTFASLSSEAAEFAKQFNIPLSQATEGLYETISDQFSGMSERANVMTAAVKLARVGVMDFQDATTLLTGTLNAFGMASGEADSVASKFFTTINLGHVRGKELADVMGQVIPIASEMGVNLNELNSAMIALTIGGQDAHKSATGLRGAMMALLKPSEDMKKVIRELGFSSPEQLVQAKGFQGALQAVAEASHNMASGIGQSVRNVRALTAELRLTQSGAEKVEAAMKAMEASTPEALDKIFKQFTSTDAEKLTSQINRLKIDLTQDFGSAITRVLGTVMELAGGADKLSAAIQGLAFGTAPLVVALGVLGTAFMTFGYTMGPVGWTIMGVTAALGLLLGGKTYLTAKSINETRRLSQEEHAATLLYLKDKEEELRKLREVEEQKRQEENRSWSERSAMIRRDYFKALDDLKDKNKEIIESDRQAMQSMVASQERVVAAYRNAANAALRIVQESQSRRATLEDQYSDLMFKKWTDEDVKFSDSQKARLVLQRSWQLEAQANEALAKAQSEDDVRRAQAIAQRAKAYLDEGTALAKETGETWLQDQAHRSIRTNLEQRIAAEKKLETLQAARAQKLAEEAAKEQGRLDRMKSLMKAILSDLDAFDKKGEAKSPQELAEQQKRLTANMKEFREQWLGGKKVDVAELLAFDQLQRRVTMALEGGVSKAEVEQLYAAPDTFAKFRADIEKGVGPVRLMIQWANLSSPRLQEATKGMSALETWDYFEKEMSRTKAIIDRFVANKDALKLENNALEQKQREITASLDRWVNVGGFTADLDKFGGLAAIKANAKSLFPGRFQGVRDALAGLNQAIEKFNAPGAMPSAENLETLKAAYDKYLEVVKPSAASKEGFNQFLLKAEQAASAAEKIDTLQKGLKAQEKPAAEAAQDRAALEEALKAVDQRARKAGESAGEMKTGTQAAGEALSKVSQIDMSTLVSQTQSIADAMWSAAMASSMVQAPTWEMTAAHGGKAWNFLATGGRPQGTDVIPAMLSPGEVVINAASARRFASQLTAINAGVQPVYRSEGGSVTNVGDINVNVTGGGSSRQTARSIAAELRRELRRGTATL